MMWRGRLSESSLELFKVRCNRRGVLALKNLGTGLAILLSIWFGNSISAQEAAKVFDYQDVVKKAEALAKQPYAAPTMELSPDLQHLDYDQYRRIRFLPEHALWPGAPYRIGFHHPGYRSLTPVLFHEIEKDRLRDIAFSPSYFFYDSPINFSGHEQFVGFRAYVPEKQSGLLDEFIVFQGASYFRAVAKGVAWGLSARGLGVNIGISAPEEFPIFREFWMRKPNPGDEALQFYALLDGPSVTGGYQFSVKYGETTVVDVKATVFIRQKPEVLVFAPLSSMFYFGGNTVNKPILKPDYQPTGKMDFSMNKTDFNRREFRPQVHDSDGVLMDTTSGEKLWVPLNNPRSVNVRRFSSVVSFSLVQRDRDLSDYLDREANYHRRPTVTVVPKSDFGPGYVRLLEFPTADEYTDNIGVGWEPQAIPDPGGHIELAYQLLWRGDEPNTDQFRVVSTTVRPNPAANETRFLVEYAKPEKGETIPVAELRPLIQTGDGAQVKDIEFTPTNRGWLVGFTVFTPNASQPLDISCVILRRDVFSSEKWLYLLNI